MAILQVVLLKMCVNIAIGQDLGENEFSIRLKSLHTWILYERKKERKSLSRVRFFATPWTVAYHALPSMGFSRQEYWSGLPFPSPGDLPDPGIEPGSPAL